MLKQRILTALILIPLVIAGIVYLPTSVIAIILGLLMLQGAWEWSRMAGLQSRPERFVYVFAVLLMLWYGWTIREDQALTQVFANAAGIAWLLATVWILFPSLGQNNSLCSTIVKLFAGILVIVLTWVAMVHQHAQAEHGPLWVLYFMFLIWIADSGAYFAGRAFGKHKLAPVVSPGKTWEGVAGAAVMVFLYALTAQYWLPVNTDFSMHIILLSLFLVPVSVIGDLFESLMKRQSGIKDSGTLLPGHGGVMDRIDSMTAVFPVTMWIATQVNFL